MALWELVRLLEGFVFSPARCPYHPPHKAEVEWESGFSRRRLDRETACTGLHGSSCATFSPNNDLWNFFREEPEKVEETDEDLIERAEKEFFKTIEVEKKMRETKHAESSKALQDAKSALEKGEILLDDPTPEKNVDNGPITEESEVCLRC